MSETNTTTITHTTPSNPVSNARLDVTTFSEPLTAFSVGYKEPEKLDELVEFLAPSIPVSRRFEYKKANEKEGFLSETDDLRTIGSSFKRVEYSGESIQGKTLNKGLTIRIDHDNIMEPDWQERTVQILIQRLYRNELRRIIQIIDQAANETLLNWNDTANPDLDLQKILAQATDESGIRPNRLIFGEEAWLQRQRIYELKNSSLGLHNAILGKTELAQKLLVKEIHTIHARYQSDKAKERFIDNCIYAYFAQNGLNKDEPSNLKRFVTPAFNGGKFGVYLEEHAKYTDISVEHYSHIAVTSPLGIKKITLENKNLNTQTRDKLTTKDII